LQGVVAELLTRSPLSLVALGPAGAGAITADTLAL
jgi:hypothetical protein